MEIPEELKSFLFLLAIVQIIGYLDLANPQNTAWILLSYTLSQLLIFVLCYVIYSRIKQTNDTTVVTTTEPPRPFHDEPERTVELSVYDYDIQKMSEIIKGSVIPLMILPIIYWKFGTVQPFLIQTIMPWRSFLRNPLVRVHLLRQKSEGELSRPFQPPRSKLLEWFKSQDDQDLPPKKSDIPKSKKAGNKKMD